MKVLLSKLAAAPPQDPLPPDLENELIAKLADTDGARGTLWSQANAVDLRADSALKSRIEQSPTRSALYIAGEVGGSDVCAALVGKGYADLPTDLKYDAIVALTKLGGREAVSQLASIVTDGSAEERRLALNGLDLLAQLGSIEGSYGGARRSSKRAQQLWSQLRQSDSDVYPIKVLMTLAEASKSESNEAMRARHVLDSLLAATEPQLEWLAQWERIDPMIRLLNAWEPIIRQDALFAAQSLTLQRSITVRQRDDGGWDMVNDPPHVVFEVSPNQRAISRIGGAIGEFVTHGEVTVTNRQKHSIAAGYGQYRDAA